LEPPHLPHSDGLLAEQLLYLHPTLLLVVEAEAEVTAVVVAERVAINQVHQL
jgi:hypothetical protein